GRRRVLRAQGQGRLHVAASRAEALGEHVRRHGPGRQRHRAGGPPARRVAVPRLGDLEEDAAGEPDVRGGRWDAHATVRLRPAATAAPRERTRRRRLSFEGSMLAPALILLAALSIFPFIYMILMSLSRVGLIGGISLHWAGLHNWSRLFSDPIVGASWLRAAL